MKIKLSHCAAFSTVGALSGAFSGYLINSGRTPIEYKYASFALKWVAGPQAIAASAVHGALFTFLTACGCLYFHDQRHNDLGRFGGWALTFFFSGAIPSGVFLALYDPGVSVSDRLWGLGFITPWIFIVQLNPITNFAWVAFLYYWFLVRKDYGSRPDWGSHAFAGCFSGVLGSLPWWIYYGFAAGALVHGLIWGLLIGTTVGFICDSQVYRKPAAS